MNKKIIDFRLISISLLISLLISDYLFGSILGNWIELCLIFLLFILSTFIIKSCSLFSYFNTLLTQLLTICLYVFLSKILKNSLFKEDLIGLFFFSIILFIISLLIKQKDRYQNTGFILIDFLITLMGIVFYILLSLYYNIKSFNFYHLSVIIFIQCFFVYPSIFIFKKIFLKIYKMD